MWAASSDPRSPKELFDLEVDIKLSSINRLRPHCTRYEIRRPSQPPVPAARPNPWVWRSCIRHSAPALPIPEYPNIQKFPGIIQSLSKDARYSAVVRRDI